MIREMVHIDEELCDGCGACIPNCHEGALQMIDGKARLISDLMCDGLGACLGHCPQGAITIKKREAGPYNETKVMEIMVGKGENTVVAHLRHMKDHNEMEFLREGVQYLKDHRDALPFDVEKVLSKVHHARVEEQQLACGCAGSEARSFTPQSAAAGSIPAAGALSMATGPLGEQPSELRQWPVQMHLINPGASYFRQSDLLLAADCVAFSAGNFHSGWLRGKTLAIACPKLDSGLEEYVDKIRALIDEAKINTLTVMMMQVPCCGGLMQMVRMAAGQAGRKVPVKKVIVGVEGDILSEEWVQI
ncbi:MAG: 4Fe-4S binding protein [Bacteroidales bacterium]|nr:4Fe-4S binding protein [Bacteroidales bacterium]